MYKYDFSFSFAGENRAIVEQLTRCLQKEKVRIFFYPDEEADTWGKDLEQKLPQVYVEQSRFFVPFVSTQYIAKKWTMYEFEQAQIRDFKESTEYILPIRLDDSNLPGLKESTAYIDLSNKSIDEVCKFLLSKLVRDSFTRQLFLFLRENNPDAMEVLDKQGEQLLIRVSMAKAHYLEQILENIDQHICSGRNHHNTLMNGGFGPVGCIPSVDPEPHTTFSLQLYSGFYSEFSAQP